MSEFLREGWVTVRKPRKCASCGEKLQQGSEALVNVSVDCGSAFSSTLCPTCGKHWETCEHCRDADGGLWSDIEECMRIQALGEETEPLSRLDRLQQDLSDRYPHITPTRENQP